MMMCAIIFLNYLATWHLLRYYLFACNTQLTYSPDHTSLNKKFFKKNRERKKRENHSKHIFLHTVDWYSGTYRKCYTYEWYEYQVNIATWWRSSWLTHGLWLLSAQLGRLGSSVTSGRCCRLFFCPGCGGVAETHLSPHSAVSSDNGPAAGKTHVSQLFIWL